MNRKSSGSGLMILLIALLICWAMWLAAQRTVRLDDVRASTPANWPDMRIDVNSATAAELSLLPGLGPKLAQRIVDDRTQRGRFNSLDDLKRVSGIGPAIIERIAPWSVVEVAGQINAQPRRRSPHARE